MSLRYSGAVVGSIGIVGFTGIKILDVAGDTPAALVESKLTWVNGRSNNSCTVFFPYIPVHMRYLVEHGPIWALYYSACLFGYLGLKL